MRYLDIMYIVLRHVFFTYPLVEAEIDTFFSQCDTSSFRIEQINN